MPTTPVASPRRLSSASAQLAAMPASQMSGAVVHSANQTAPSHSFAAIRISSEHATSSSSALPTTQHSPSPVAIDSSQQSGGHITPASSFASPAEYKIKSFDHGTQDGSDGVKKFQEFSNEMTRLHNMTQDPTLKAKYEAAARATEGWNGKNTKHILLDQHGNATAVMATTTRRSDEPVKIEDLAAHPDYKGDGAKLLNHAKQISNGTVHLTAVSGMPGVDADNNSLVAYYQKSGFVLKCDGTGSMTWTKKPDEPPQ